VRLGWLAIATLIVAGVPAHADDDATSRHLLAGVHAFRDGRYEEALVELRIVARAPDAPADLAFYLGPTLVKLGRDREAIAVFVASPAPLDPLTDFYLGEAYYHERMYRKARAVFAKLRARGLGPVLDEAAGAYVAAVDAAYRTAPEGGTIDAYVARARAERDPLVAAELYDEARQVEALATDHRRHAEIVAALAAAWNATNRQRATIDLLAADAARSSDATWQLARAYVGLQDVAHARPLLAALAKAGGVHSSEAAALLATLP
jgi:hypothetical protein